MLSSKLIEELHAWMERKGDHQVVNCLGEALTEVDWDKDDDGECFVLGFTNDDIYNDEELPT